MPTSAWVYRHVQALGCLDVSRGLGAGQHLFMLDFSFSKFSETNTEALNP